MITGFGWWESAVIAATADDDDDDDDDDDGTLVFGGAEIVVISSPQWSFCDPVHEARNSSTSAMYLIAHNTVGVPLG